MEEMIDIYDENFNKIGVKSRFDVHKYGFKHKVVQCYIINKIDNSKWIYFQQRSFDKDSYPGFYDIACAGHIDSGEQASSSMIRELQEEIGLRVEKSQLNYAGTKLENKNHGNILDDEICELYVLSIENENFVLGEEVEDMVKVLFNDYKSWINEQYKVLKVFSIKHKKYLELNEKNICGHIRDYNKDLLKVIENI
ncbi:MULTISPECIES: NUDIX hydrolase [Clostridium]|uniref:NUDIX hydrolase n=1 Tax=Clostridium TaxID=1485 RepID=UPI0006E6D962|nr:MULTISPECIES: NUDIX domain-containing protein [Clostridium]ALS17291.1 NUDIX hydrolase [Clostridium butyricum]KQB79612.1 NUDIX hydrolase [Clostridium butyricum]MDM8131250.1 NUDIX domain-containing protein [Clostridium butyricum]MDM8229451.1 NUDIX domain-containing protein [Clostridium butyricum]MDU1117353.1 NUDIX domain-containing protein [Clostridium sp.]